MGKIVFSIDLTPFLFNSPLEISITYLGAEDWWHILYPLVNCLMYECYIFPHGGLYWRLILASKARRDAESYPSEVGI